MLLPHGIVILLRCSMVSMRKGCFELPRPLREDLGHTLEVVGIRSVRLVCRGVRLVG